MRFCRTPVFLAAACLPIWVEAQTAPPPAPNQSGTEAEAPAKPQPPSEDQSEVHSARDAVRRAGGGGFGGGGVGGGGFGGGGGGLQSVQAPNPANRERLREWLASRQPTEKGAWIGISTSPAAPVLRHQLKLPEGTGLVVDFVQPKSPADQAGVKQYDLLQKLDDQLLINSEQFAVLVRTFKAGDEVKLTLFREGKHQTLSVKLAEHELPRLPEFLPFQFQEVNPPQPMPQMPGQGSLRGSSDLYGSTRAESSYTWLDGKGVLTIKTENGHSTVTGLEKPSGKVLFTYPIDTDEERSALPKEIRERLARLKFPPGAKYDELRLDSDSSKDPTTPGEPAPPPPAAR